MGEKEGDEGGVRGGGEGVRWEWTVGRIGVMAESGRGIRLERAGLGGEVGY